MLDQKRFGEYIVKAHDSIVAAGGRFIVVGGDVEVLEGDAPAGPIVIFEFPTKQAAIDWYQSDEHGNTEDQAGGRMYVIEGVK